MVPRFLVRGERHAGVGSFAPQIVRQPLLTNQMTIYTGVIFRPPAIHDTFSCREGAVFPLARFQAFFVALQV